MAAASDQNSNDAASSLGRSSSIDARDGALPRSDSQRRSASKAGRKGGRSGNDLFVCFAPRTTLTLVSANRPVVSPARDKGKDTGSARRNSRNLSASIFATKAPSKKQGYDAEEEEPTSPKVTCIGQVRSKSKSDKRRRGSPAAPRRQGSASEGKKESACPSFAKDFSCFGMPCDSYGSLPSFRGDKKSSGTVFAKSLVLIQNEDEGKTTAMEASTSTAKVLKQNLSEPKSVCDLSAASKKALLQEDEMQTESVPVLQETMSVVSVPGSNGKREILQVDALAEDQTSAEEDDAFETEAPPSNALLLMRSKVDHLRVLVPPPSINITLKRSTSAPAHCRRKSEDADTTEQLQAHGVHASATDANRNNLRLVISSEDLPKPPTATKSFLQRCKSVSRSLSRSSSERAEEVKTSPIAQEMKAAGGPNAGFEASILEEHKGELHLVSEVMSRRRSDSEALKVSLDIVPETWLWEARAIARQESKETTGSWRKLEKKKQGGGGGVSEWLDGELEAALWKSCQVADIARSMPRTCTEASQSTGKDPMLGSCSANQVLDAEVEATLWRCCSLVASHSSQDLQSETAATDPPLKGVESETKSDGTSMDIMTQSKTINEETEGIVEKATTVEKNSCKQGVGAAAHSSSLGRSASVGSQGGKQLLDKGLALRKSASVGGGWHQHAEQQERARYERRNSTDRTKKERPSSKENRQKIAGKGIGQSLGIGQSDDLHVNVTTSDGYTTTCVVEADLWRSGRPFDENLTMGISQNDRSRRSDVDGKGAAEGVKDSSEEEALDAEDIAAPSPSSVLDRPVPPPSPALATPPEAVLFVRYDIGAFRISLDAPAKTEVQGADHHQQQQKAMLEAISHLHIHDVQKTYTRLLKAASGKERASLSSAAFRLQRCKSEPVRLASY